MGNWQREDARFCPGLRCGAARRRPHVVADAVAEHDLSSRRIRCCSATVRWLAHQWHLVVLDEAQNIKMPAPTPRRWGEMQARHRLCLSGTPMENPGRDLEPVPL